MTPEFQCCRIQPNRRTPPVTIFGHERVVIDGISDRFKKMVNLVGIIKLAPIDDTAESALVNFSI